ncbi:PucR family transcriptional regulator [Nocardia vinacea]|uniref:PucR family transcriptional regulator n=1 Tax=Nocardia vinacea TaxID=96468 RepID=UPI0002F38E5A|nr:helix-turn-helix domain-containing protein [Nocardia vinacea]
MTESPIARICHTFAANMLYGQDISATNERLQAAAARWARESVPIDTIHRAIRDGVQIALDHRAAESDDRSTQQSSTTTPQGRENLLDEAELIMRVIDRMSSVISQAYVRELRTIVGEYHEDVHNLTAALLDGRPTSTMARECGIEIAQSYSILALSIPRHHDERDAALDGREMKHRRLRRIRSELITRCGETALVLWNSMGGTALVPDTQPAAGGLDELVRHLSRAAEIPITATVTAAAPPDLPSAASQAHELLDMVVRMGCTPGLYRFDDLVLEYQLTRPGPGREYLGSLLDSLDEHPELLETLERHIANDLNRQRTAHSLHVHANTVDYRLRRIGRLTGFDPTQVSGLWYLRSALLARSYRIT